MAASSTSDVTDDMSEHELNTKLLQENERLRNEAYEVTKGFIYGLHSFKVLSYCISSHVIFLVVLCILFE